VETGPISKKRKKNDDKTESSKGGGYDNNQGNKKDFDKRKVQSRKFFFFKQFDKNQRLVLKTFAKNITFPCKCQWNNYEPNCLVSR